MNNKTLITGGTGLVGSAISQGIKLSSKDGDLNIHVKFEDAKALKKFEEDSEKLLGDLRNSFVFKENKVSGVFAFTYEKEAVATDIKIEGASVVRN